MSGVLSGIRVLDFGRYIAGPYCATLLGDFGADVIRVEKTGGSEDRYLAPLAETGEGGLFLQMNRNKRSLTLDPMTEEGREVVRKLVATADVVVANLPPPTLKAMGLDYESLRVTRPDIILTTVSAFGAGGPYSHKVGFDGVGQAMSGSAYMSGDERGPRRSFAPWVDFGTALGCAFGTVAALLSRRETGKGQIVEGTLLRTAMTFTNSLLIEQALTGINRVPTANRGQTSAPANIFKTGNGWIMVQVIGQPLFRRWVKLIGEDHWLNDPRFKDDISRGDHGEVISVRMAHWCAERSTTEALAALEDARIPAGPVYTQQEVLDDPHVAALGMLRPMGFPGLKGEAPIMESQVKLSVTPGRLYARAPMVGEHTETILGEIGYGTEAVAALRLRGIV